MVYGKVFFHNVKLIYCNVLNNLGDNFFGKFLFPVFFFLCCVSPLVRFTVNFVMAAFIPVGDLKILVIAKTW